MERLFLRLLSLAICLLAFVPVLAQAAATKLNFNGSYALAGNRTDRVFTLDITMKGTRATISFSASMTDGTGAAPDADGTGKVEDGVLTIKFKDSFNNEGTCKLQLLPGSSIYQLDMVVTKVVEPSPLHFYGKLQLKKVADKPVAQ